MGAETRMPRPMSRLTMPAARPMLSEAAQMAPPIASVGATAGLPVLRAQLLTRVSGLGAASARAISEAACVVSPVCVARTCRWPSTTTVAA